VPAPAGSRCYYHSQTAVDPCRTRLVVANGWIDQHLDHIMVIIAKDFVIVVANRWTNIIVIANKKLTILYELS
jgi:hypothetical protein